MRWPAALLLLAACGPGPVVVVTLSGLPAGAAQIEAATALSGVESDPIARLDIRDLALARSALSFGLRLPAGALGALALGVRAVDDQGCLLAVGAARVQVFGADVSPVDVALQRALPADCRRRLPILGVVAPTRAAAAGGQPAAVLGWGLRPGAQLTVAGVPVSAVEWRSTAELAILLPAAPRPGPALVELRNPDGARDRLLGLTYAFGTVGFASPTYSAALSSQISRFVAADIDGDGQVDVTAVGASAYNPCGLGQPRVGLGLSLNQQGQLALSTAETYCGPYTGLSLGDVDGDQRPDAVLWGAGQIEVVIGRGTLRRSNGSRIYPIPGAPTAVAVADLDGDRRAEIALLDPAAGVVRVLRNRGDGTFASDGGTALPIGGSPQALAVVDLSGDDRPAVVVALPLADEVRVLRNRGDGTFDQGQAYPVGAGPQELAAADLDGDGRPELVTANLLDGTISVLRNRGDGGLAPQAPRDHPLSRYATALLLGDVDGDGLPDVLAADQLDSGLVHVLLNQGAGTFTTDPRAGLSVPIGRSAAPWIALGDVDDDGRQDLIFQAGAHLGVQRNTSE